MTKKKHSHVISSIKAPYSNVTDRCRTLAPRKIRVGGPSSRAIYSSPAITGRVICLFYIMLNPGVFLERPSHAFWFEPCGTLIIWRSVFSTLCKVERLALDTGLQGTKCNQDIGLSHCFILNRFFHSLYVRCDVAIIFYTIKDHRHDVWCFFRFYPFFLTLSVKTLFFRIKQINCKSTRLLRFYRY